MPRSVAELDTFITLIRVAREDTAVRSDLVRLLARPASARHALVHTWVSDLLIAQAPQEFIDAIACLSDDAIAAQVLAVLGADAHTRDTE